MIVIKVKGNASLQHSKLQMGGLGDGLCSCTQKNPSVSKHSRLCGSSMKSVSIHTFARVCDGSVVQSGRTLVSKTKCQRFKSFRGRHVFGGVAQLGERLVCNQNVAGSIPVTSTMYGEREALVTSGDCKSSTLGYTGFESLALHQIL